MKPSEALIQHRDQVRDIIKKYPVENPRIFGSVLHGEDGEESDLDIIVDSTNQTTLFNLIALEREIEQLLGFEVDLMTVKELKPHIRAEVLEEAMAL